LSTFFTGLVTYFGFQAIEAFVHSATYTGSTSLKSPYIFFGMLIGAMLPYYFGSNLLRSIEKTAPAIPYDIRMQI
jgi:Na+/H+-translocating membrane pyrophosphatase